MVDTRLGVDVPTLAAPPPQDLSQIFDVARGCPDSDCMTKRHAAAAVVLLTGLISGCSYEVKRATHVTADAATLKAKVHCGSRKHVRKHGRFHGRLWWQLRQSGTPGWKRVSRKRHFACGERRKRIVVSKRVHGLRAGAEYQFRLALDPRRRGGRRVFSPVRRFRTRGSAPPAPRQLTLRGVKGFKPGLVGTADHGRSALAAKRLGADIVRLEFEIGTPPASLRAGVAAVADQGAQALLLAGFHGRMPTEAEARNLAGWAAEFGPGGSFWNGRPDGQLAVRQIEFGNETSYSYQYGDTWSDQSYKDRSKLYATRFSQAQAAIGATGREVGLLAQADDGGTGSAAWVDGMFDAVPNLGQLVDGWTVHPYGPRGSWEPKLDRLIAQTAANGAPGTIPIDITEYGLSTNNGIALNDNYGWPVNLTFAQAGSALDSTVAEMRADAAIGPRLRLFMLYSAYDLGASLGPNARERFFGALSDTLADKGGYSTEARELFAP
ncbi:MAG: hypothetical protein QOD13_3812 [Thermoleophilaceae bacterium]|nr:hypothetical protein [Thermoleophilaceae bacterium]